jgi:hypothetical protein
MKYIFNFFIIFYIKIKVSNNTDDSVFMAMIKNIGIKNVLNDDVI